MMRMTKIARKRHILDKTPKRLPGTTSFHSLHSTDGWASGVRPFIYSGQGWPTFSVKGQIINYLWLCDPLPCLV